MDLAALRKLLCERLCRRRASRRAADGALMLRNALRVSRRRPAYPIHLTEAGPGGLQLSDRGHTLMHISYEHDVDTFLIRHPRHAP